jgi:predicted AlkP superfamily phosphohydrolase/phosphomutase
VTVQVLFLGLDGATFSVLDPLMAAGVMPNLRRISESGVRSPMQTVMPPLTPPGWTSLVTGRRPGRHGVFDFFQKDTPDSEFFRLSNSLDIHTETIWSLASAAGRRVISLNFPLMFPAPPVNGYVVPGGWMPWKQLRLGCHPRSLFDRLKQLPSFDPRELSLDMELEAKAVDGCPDEEYADWVALHIRREQRWFEIMRHLLESESPELVGVVFDGVDKLQHLVWRFLDPAFRPADPTPWEADMTQLCESYFRNLDEIIGELVDIAGRDATVIFGSDHGFGPTDEVLYINTWLEEHGYLFWADDVATTEATGIGFDEMTRHIHTLDWSRTLAYAATPSSQGIHVVAREPGTDERLSAERRDEIVRKLAADLRAARHPETGQPIADFVVTREESFAGPYDACAPDVSIMPADGLSISILRSETAFRARETVRGNHRFDGIFIAAGPGVRQGERLTDVSILDVAPLILHTLGVAQPMDLDGRVPDVLTQEALARRPVTYATVPTQMQPLQEIDLVTPFAQDIDDVPLADVYDEEDEATVINRLRTLGYVE